MGELRRLYYPIMGTGSFKTFKWILKGRWNQGTGNSGTTRTYLQWDELGISYVGSNGVKYGPTYWTVDSYSSSGSLWSSRPASEMFDGEWGSETSKSDYKDINDTDGYVEIIIHTTSGEAIVPNGVGLISTNTQASYASATPAHFILYGLNESTNEYVELIDVPASSVNKGSNQTTTVSFKPVEVVTGIRYLLAPSELSRGSGLRWEINIPMDLDFLYQAKDFDGNKIPNKAINPKFGDYLQAGTLTKNGSGSGCYLNNGSSQNNYLYVDLTADQLTAIKALTGNTYTWFFRVANTSGMGGIMSTRNGDGNFVYMFRSNGSQLQIHNSVGRNLGTNFTLASENVFKVRISGSNYYAKNLTNGSEWSITDGNPKVMSSNMKTFYAGAGTGGSESILAAFYAMAGIPRDTTADEDEIMKNCLLNQSI